MRNSFSSRLRGVLGALVLAAAASFAAPTLASDSLSSTALSRMADSSAIVSTLSESPDGRVPVIVEFSTPEVPALAAASAARGSAAADEALTAAVHDAQSSILGRALELPDMGALSAAMESEALNIKRMDFVPMFAVTADAALLERLAADPMVERIYLDAQNEPFLTTSLPLIGMPATYAAGATGTGWHVAVLDTGGRRSHEFLNSRIVSAACYSTNTTGVSSLCPGGATSSTHIDSANDCSDGTPGCGHGTHVAGIAGGFFGAPQPGNPSNGVSRNGRIISINVFSRGTGGLTAFNSDIILGLNRVYALRNTYQIAAANLSLGMRGSFNTTPCDTHEIKPVVDLLRSAGIATIFAAGNDGYSTGISTPACISTAIAVASSTSGDVRSSFSNWGNLVGLVAPGGQISGNVVTEGILSSYVSGTSNTFYSALPGTSMAAPHVAGAFGVLRAAVPSASIDQILSALQTTGTPITVGSITRNRINVDRALSVLRGTNPTTTTLTGPTSSIQGNSVTFTATVAAASGGTPSGSVTFRRDGNLLGTVSLSSGTAVLSTSTLPLGTHQITAAYGGSGTHGASTSSPLSHTVTSEPGTRPANDDFANRITIPAPGTVTGSNVDATDEPGEPIHANRTSARNSVWWRYTPSSSGQVTIDTVGSNFDTVLAVYTGSAVNALTHVASNDDTPGIGLLSRVEFTAQAGVSYAIAVAGFGGTSGNISLNVAGGGGGGGGPSDVEVSLTVPDGVVRPGAPARLVADVTSVNAGAGTPSGTVRFSANGSTVGSATLSSGRAMLNTTLPVGSNSVIAHYQGTGTHNAGNSPARTVVVSAAMGPEITVNQRTRHNQRRPAISPLRRSAVVVFEDQHVANGPFGITGQRVNWSGARIADPITVARPAEGTGYPDVAELTGNAWVVVWEATGRGGRQDVFMRRFRVNGRAMDRTARGVNDRGAGHQTRPRVAALEDGGYAVVWQSNRADGDGEGIVMRIFDGTGNPRTDEFVVNQTTRGDQTGPDVAMQQDGDIVVSWAGPTASGYGAYAQRVSVQGRLIGDEIEVGQAGSTLMPQVRIAALDNGNFAVAHEASDRLARPGPYRVIVQRLRQRGPLWGDPVPMMRVRAGDQRTPAIAGLRRMGLVTAWRAPDGGRNGVWMQTLGRDGAPISAPEQANTTIPRNQFDPAVSRVGTTRHFFVVWTATGTAAGDGTNIIIRRFMGP